MVLKDLTVYGGTIFLDPRCAVIKGGRVEEKAAIQDELFLAGLRTRMGSAAPFDGTFPMMLITPPGYL